MAAIKTQFTVCLLNQPGQLASLCALLARGKVNVLAISVAEAADVGLVRFVADSAVAVRKALKKSKLQASERDVVAIDLPNQPGALAKAAAKLAKAKVNIDYVYGTTGATGAQALCVLAVCDTAKAARVLG